MRPSYSPAASNRFMLVVVLGSGLLMAGVLAYYFGGPSVPISKPASADDSQARAGAANSTVYQVQVTTVPDGAQVTLAGQTRPAPTEFELSSFKPPVLVTAALAGHVSTSRELTESDFVRTGDNRLEAKIVMALPAEQPAQASDEQGAAGAPAARASAPEPSRTQEHASRHHSTHSHHADQAEPSKALREAPPAPAATDSDSESKPVEAEAESKTPAAADLDEDQAPSAPAPAGSTAGTSTALEQATACMLRGDNACVIRVLAGSAHSMKELEMLIETYRATGDFAHAERQMAVYVERFPSGRRAAEYRRLLAKNNGDGDNAASAPGP